MADVVKFTDDELEVIHNSLPALQRTQLGRKLNEAIDKANSGGGGGPDTTAIHKAIAGEINAMTLKGTPIGADILVIEDSASGFSKKKIPISSLPSGGGSGAEHIDMMIDGNMYVGNGISAKPLKIGFVASEVEWTLEESPVGSDAVFQLQYSTDGYTWTTIINTGTIADGEHQDINIISHAFANNSFVRVNCIQKGLTTPGKRLFIGVK